MAEKEATVFIVDLGRSMGGRSSGRDEPHLDWAMQYVWDRITSAVATGRKTLMMGVVGLRTDDTSNELDDDPSFGHISVLHPISQILMSDLAQLRDKIRVSSTNEGDAISALVIAIQMISRQCRQLKYRRKIVLITDGQGPMDDDDIEEIVKKIKGDAIELVVLGIDFDDPEFGMKEEDKDPVKAAHERLLKNLTEQCEGVFGTMEQAISELSIPRVKVVNSNPTFKGHLTLGDPGGSTSMHIAVWRYAKTLVAKAPSASQFVERNELSKTDSGKPSSVDGVRPGGEDAADSKSSLAAVRNFRTYQVDDEGGSGGKLEVDRSDLAKGYLYGRTAVALSESDENVTKLETTTGLEIIGFIPRPNYERFMNLSTANVLVAPKGNTEASLALSSFIHALFELDNYGIARLVPKDDKPPVIVLLAPSIELDYECLLEVQLPFAEDVRSYRFPPLDRVVTVSGKVMNHHPNLPNARLHQAMSDYVDQMDLSTFGRDDEGNETEYMAMEDTYSPLLHRIDQAVRWRAIHPSDPIPPAPEILTRYSKPPIELERQARPHLETLIAAAEIAKVPPKPKGRRHQNRDSAKPLSGLNVDELLGREKRSSISAANAVPEFKQLLATAQDPHAIEDASKQMSHIIRSLIQHSLGDSGYGRALEALRVMRDELMALEEPRSYNDFLRRLKQDLLRGALQGDRKEMWYEIRRHQLGLITAREVAEVADVDMADVEGVVSDEEAKLFLSSK